MDRLDLQTSLESLIPRVATEEVMDSMNERIQRICRVFGPGGSADRNREVMGSFVIFYLSTIPSMLTEMERMADRYKLENLMEPYIKVSTGYLDSTCRALGNSAEKIDTAGLISLLQGAYIFHRLIEELNDQVELFIGLPLLDQNTMVANIMVHDIIGDRFANRLDQIIESMIEHAVITKTLIEAQLGQQAIKDLKAANQALSGKTIRCIAGEFGFTMDNSLTADLL